MFRVPAILILVFIVSTSYSQNIPCKSYPMGGYHGNCGLTSALSADRKYLYTSDRVTLKKWDIATSKVVEEIPGFMHPLAGGTDNPRLVRVIRESGVQIQGNNDLYDLGRKSLVVNPEIAFLNLLSEDKRKAFRKVLSASSFNIYFNADSTFAALAETVGKIYQVEVTTGKMKLISEGSTGPFINELNTLVVFGPKDKKYLVNFVTGEKMQFTATGGFEASIVTPDKKYIVFSGRDGLSFVDRKTGNEVFKHYGGRVFFKSDLSMFYVFSIAWENDGTYSVHHALTFGYPDFKKLERIDTRWTGFASPHSLNFDPDKGVFYSAGGGRDIKTHEIKVPISVAYVPSQEDLNAEVSDRERNVKIGNEALEKLSTMKTPPIVNVIEPYITHKISSYSDNGKVVVYSKYGDGGSVIVWSFPEGMPIAAFRDQLSSARGASESAVLVPGNIQKASISPGGKVIALETNGALLFYAGEVQTSVFAKRILLGLLDNAALLSDYNYKDVIVVDPATGKTIGKVKTKGERDAVGADPRINPGVFTIKEKERIGIIDPASPSEIRYTPITQLPESDAARYDLKRWTLVDNATGNETVLPGIKPLTGVDESKVQSNFLIAFYFNEGYYIYDLKQKKTINEKPIYPGWMTDNHVIFLPGINKLLVWTSVPVFTRPNATENDPGASAFTIDVKTGEITPYLMSEPRSAYIEKENAEKAAAFKYASLPCEEKKRSYGPGDNIGSASHPASIVLGYDCDRKAYVVARRSLLYPGTNSMVQVSRLFPITEEELSSQGYIKVKKSHAVCPLCHGYPMEFSKQTTSGWSDWEQKSLNIYLYTREWETKTETIGTRCSTCKGDAWIKLD
ncbi:hypothetical protein [Chryseolinea sp. H1M3-3]|uniref:hypothetical protein n=1 Tax=Chryseolinea sp. H1M3-3 TaxID=3034144 RepID=UPI0023ECBFD9|nr:hypothetical protein [Chryseolinea sp. H1M3-3]